MAITVITGTPGAGKTLFAVKQIVEKWLLEDWEDADGVSRPRIVWHNINGLDQEAVAEIVGEERAANLRRMIDFTPREWMAVEDGCRFVFDECQSDYRARNPQSKVPPWVAPLETHRHRGFDFVFITQHPTMLDSHVQNLCDQHFHLYRPFGLERATLLHWDGAICRSPTPQQSRETATGTNFSYPKELYAVYKSSVSHTMKKRIPWKLVAVMGGVAASAVLVAFLGYRALDNFRNPEGVQSFADAATGSIDSGCYPIFAIVADRWLASVEGRVYTVPERYIRGSDPNDGYCPTEDDGAAFVEARSRDEEGA